MISRWIGVVAVVAVLSGCPSDPYDPQTWIEKLDTPNEIDEAVNKLVELKCPEAIRPLGTAWRKYAKKGNLLQAIIKLADQPDAAAGKNQDCTDAGDGPFWTDAVPVLIEMIEEHDVSDQPSVSNAIMAADALGRSRDPAALQVLINTATRSPKVKRAGGERLRLAATRALGRYGDNERAVDTLVKVLAGKEQPLQVTAAAAISLADTGSAKAIDPLLTAAYTLAPIYGQARNALTRVGRPAADALVDVFRGKNKTVNKLATDLNFASHSPGNVTYKAALLLGDMRVARAISMLVAQLDQPGRLSFVNERTGQDGPLDHAGVISALRALVATKTAARVGEYMVATTTSKVVRPTAIDAYSMLATSTDKLDWLAGNFNSKDEDLRSASAVAYARLVTQKAQLAPLQAVVSRQLQEAKKRAKKAAKAKEGKKTELEGQVAAYRGFAREYEQHLTRAKVGIECGGKVACYAELLGMTSKEVVAKLKIPNHRSDDMKKQDQNNYRIAAVERALLELAKKGKKAESATPAVLAIADSTDRVVREGVLLALPRIAPRPCPDCVTKLNAVIEEQKSQGTLANLSVETKVVRNYFEVGLGSGKK